VVCAKALVDVDFGDAKSLMGVKNMQLLVNGESKTAAELAVELTCQHESNEQLLQQKTYQLRERIKELNCLYGISRLVENCCGSREKILQGTVDLIPISWQYPESTCARIVIDGKAFGTDNFQETVWKQKANIKKYGEYIGSLEVYYLDEKPESDEGPFLQEERNLIDAIAERLGHILERIHAETELRDYREKMFRAEQLASLGTIGSALEHQLNQPLSVIRMSIQKTLRNLHKTGCPEIVKEILDDSLNQLSQASSVVKGFLALGHTSSKERISNINIYKAVKKTTAIFNKMAKNIKIRLIIDDNLKKMPTIKGIAGEIEQMFFILVQNAVQAAKPNKKQWFTISGSAKEEQVELEFSDNCGGIEQGNLDEIFEPFFTTKPADQGTGLGLAILQQIVTNHNGSVRVDSEFGQGTTFYITLPIKR
jgi:signal transduction histidine kinase